MTIEECYREIGGNYAEVSGRLPSKRLIEKFAIKFLDDQSYAQLSQAMAAGSCADAFRAAHTLKGVSANLSFAQLRASSSSLTELLRGADTIPAKASPLMDAVTRDYEMTVAAIRKLDSLAG